MAAHPAFMASWPATLKRCPVPWDDSLCSPFLKPVSWSHTCLSFGECWPLSSLFQFWFCAFSGVDLVKFTSFANFIDYKLSLTS